MNLDTPYLYILALQKGIPFYKEDGSCNFDHPEFAANLEWYKKLGNDLKIQMGAKEIKAAAPSWNYFATVDNLGMYCKGNWYTRLLNSQEDYPRDWDYGIVAVPTSGTKESNKTLLSFGYVSVNKNAAHKDEAIEYAVWRAKNQWKFENGIPALITLTAAEQAQVFDATALESRGSITVEELYKTFIDNDMGYVSSDILGPVGSEYHIILREEAELYMLDLQDLATTVKNVCARVNAAIKNL